MNALAMLAFILFAFIMGVVISAAVVVEWEERERQRLEMEGKNNEND